MTDRYQKLLQARDSLFMRWKADRILGIEEIPSASLLTPATPQTGLVTPQAALVTPQAGAARPQAEPAHRPMVPPLRELVGSAERRARLEELNAEVMACDLCDLCRTRTFGVPGEGSVDADLMFIGEGPGRDEDLSGRPFVGRAGELLSKIVTAMGFSRETVFIANIVKCRPPGNRDPQPKETSACFPYLERQIEIVEPRVICTLGLPATRTLLNITGGIGAVRGKKFMYRGTPLVPTFHPAYLLRNPAGKKQVWEDVQYVAQLVEEAGGAVPFPPAGGRVPRSNRE